MALATLASASVPAAQALAAPAACEGPASATKLTVEVRGVRSAKGEMAVTVYPDDPDRFLAHKGKLLRVRTPTKAPTTTACFYLPKPAYYAVAVYHDENGDHDFNRTIIGLPAEGFGFSNDPSTKTGLPSFKSVRFEAKGGETNIHVTLRYLR
jgi:uncharacterized protein (DUF2141 family)